MRGRSAGRSSDLPGVHNPPVRDQKKARDSLCGVKHPSPLIRCTSGGGAGVFPPGRSTPTFPSFLSLISFLPTNKRSLGFSQVYLLLRGRDLVPRRRLRRTAATAASPASPAGLHSPDRHAEHHFFQLWLRHPVHRLRLRRRRFLHDHVHRIGSVPRRHSTRLLPVSSLLVLHRCTWFTQQIT